MTEVSVDTIEAAEASRLRGLWNQSVERRPSLAARIGTLARHRNVLSVTDQAVVSGTNFLTAAFVARLCSTDQLGLYYLAVTFILILTGIQEQLIATPYTIFRVRFKRAEANQYAGSVVVHHLLFMAASWLPLAAGFSLLWFTGETTGADGLWVLLIVGPVLLGREVIRRFAFAHSRFVVAIVLDATVATVQLSGVFLLAYFHRLTIGTVFACLGVACAVACLAALAFKTPAAKVRRERLIRDWRHNWAFARWTVPSYLVGNTTPLVMAWVVTLMAGTAATGTLGACATLVNVVNVFILGVANALTPRTAAALHRGGVAELRRVLVTTGLLLVTVLGTSFLAILMFGDRIATLIYGSQFAGSGPILAVLALSVVASSVGMTTGNGLWALGAAPRQPVARRLQPVHDNRLRDRAGSHEWGARCGHCYPDRGHAGRGGTNDNSVARHEFFLHTTGNDFLKRTFMTNATNWQVAAQHPPSMLEPYSARALAVVTLVIAVVYCMPIQTTWFVSLQEHYATSVDDMESAAESGNLTRQVAFLLLGAFGALVLLRSPGRLRTGGLLGAACLAYMAWCAASVLWAIEPAISARRFAVMLCEAVAAVAISRLVTPKQMIAITLICTSFWLFLGVLAELSLGTFHIGSSDYRFAGLFHPNEMGMQCALLVMAAVSLLPVAAPRCRPAIGVAAGIGALFLVLTGSRTAIAVTGLCLSFGWVMTAFAHRRFLRLAALAGCVLLFAIVLQGIVLATLENVQSIGRADSDMASLTGRLPLWEELGVFIGERPWLGHGYGGFWTPDNIRAVSDRLTWSISSAHSSYVELTLSVGYIGTLFCILGFICALWRAMRLETRTPQQGFAFLALVLMCTLVSGLTETTFGIAGARPLFAMCAITMIAGYELPAVATARRYTPSPAAWVAGPYAASRI